MTDRYTPPDDGDAPLVRADEVHVAAKRVAGAVVRTPLLPCPWAAERGDPAGHPGAGEQQARELRLKPENLQPTGAFKLRGAYHAVASLTERQRASGVIAHSSGNHAQAVAYAAARFGAHATIVMPDATEQVKIDATRALGAEVVLVSRDRRVAAATELSVEHGYTLIPPFDDPTIIAGQGTVGREIVEDWPDVDTVLVPVSGGGLISGVAVAVKECLPHARVVGVEPELAADATESFHAGSLTSWSTEQTFRTASDGLRAASLGELPWRHIHALVDTMVTVTEEETARAQRLLATHARIVAEPSGAVTTAASLFHTAELPDTRRQVAVVSGGNVDPVRYAETLTA